MKNDSADELCRSIQDTFGYRDEKTCFSVMKSDIREELDDLGFTPWYHIHILMDSLLPSRYRCIQKKTICSFIQHVNRSKRIGLTGLLHDEQAVYNVDALVILRTC